MSQRYYASRYVDVIASERACGHGWSVMDGVTNENVCDCEKKENAELLAELLNEKQQ